MAKASATTAVRRRRPRAAELLDRFDEDLLRLMGATARVRWLRDGAMQSGTGTLSVD